MPEARATASISTPSSAPCRSSPNIKRTEEVLLVARRPAEQRAQKSRHAPPPIPIRMRRRHDRRSRRLHAARAMPRRPARRRRWLRRTRCCRWPRRSARSRRSMRPDASSREKRESRSRVRQAERVSADPEMADFLRPAARLRHRARRGHELCELHGWIVPRDSGFGIGFGIRIRRDSWSGSMRFSRLAARSIPEPQIPNPDRSPRPRAAQRAQESRLRGAVRRRSAGSRDRCRAATPPA